MFPFYDVDWIPRGNSRTRWGCKLWPSSFRGTIPNSAQDKTKNTLRIRQSTSRQLPKTAGRSLSLSMEDTWQILKAGIALLRGLLEMGSTVCAGLEKRTKRRLSRRKCSSRAVHWAQYLVAIRIKTLVKRDSNPPSTFTYTPKTHHPIPNHPSPPSYFPLHNPSLNYISNPRHTHSAGIMHLCKAASNCLVIV